MATDASMIQPTPRRTRQKSPGPGIPSHALNDALIQYAEVDITTAEVLLLNSVPITIVPTPGAGRVLEFVSAMITMDYAGTAYATNGDLVFTYTDESGTEVSDTVTFEELLELTADTVKSVQALSLNFTAAANAPLVISASDGVPATGTSPIKVQMAYRVHNTGL